MSDLLTELRPTSDPEFDAAWEAKFAPATDTQNEATETVESPVEETDTETAERARNERGQFTRVDAPAVDEHSRETELEREEEEQTPTVNATEDDLLQQYLQKYDGDVRKALIGAANAQQLIGRRDDEKDELRARLEALEARQTQPAEQPRAARPITEADVVRLDEMALTGNGQQAFLEATQMDPTGTLARRALDNWAAVNPAEAMLFAADRMSDAKIAQMRAELQPHLERGQAAEGNDKFVQSWTQLSQERPEIEQLAPVMKQVVDESPEMARMILEGDVATQVKLLGMVADAAKGRANPIVQERIAEFEAEQREVARAEKNAAAVVKGKGKVGSPTGGEASTKSPRELEAERIKAGIVDAPDTSIVSGWTTE